MHPPKVAPEAAQAMLERFQAGTTTLKAERERFHVVSNAPLRRALLPLVGSMDAYLQLVGADRAAHRAATRALLAQRDGDGGQPSPQ